MAVEGHPGLTGEESRRFTHLPQRQLRLLDIECLVLFNQLFPWDSELFGRVINPSADPFSGFFFNGRSVRLCDRGVMETSVGLDAGGFALDALLGMCPRHRDHDGGGLGL